MDFKLNIGTLTSRVSKYNNEINILEEQDQNINNTLNELYALGWSGESKEKFEQVHKQRQERYKELLDDIQYIKNALESEVKPKAINLKRRSEDFINCIKRNGNGGALTSDDSGVITLEYGAQFPISNNINNCTNDYYRKMNSNFEEIMHIANSLEGTSLGIMGYVTSAEASIQNQTTGLIDFDKSFIAYCNGIRELESNTCSIFSKISGVSDVSKFTSSSIISPSGEIDQNKLQGILLKNPDNLTDEEKEVLEYAKKLGQDKILIPVTTVDTSKFTRDSRNQIDYLLMQLDEVEEKHGLYDSITGLIKLKDYDEAVNDIWDEINDIIADESTEDTKSIAEVERRIDSVASGTLQTFGGGTEVVLGKTTIVAGAATINPIVIGGGVYIGVDGTSNFFGGISKVYNAVAGNNEGDTWNVVKNKYIEWSPKYGETIYNATQIVVGCYSLSTSANELPKDISDVAKSYPRLKNIARAEKEGLEAGTSVLDINNKIVITTKTSSGMILQRVVIDKATEVSTYNKASIATDVYNTDGSIESDAKSSK